jgi:RNA polymerase sigma-70 factor (ECF subfamily)
MEGKEMRIPRIRKKLAKPKTQTQKAAPGAKARTDRLFNELFNTYRSRVYYIARRYTSNEEDALDMVQEIFIKAYRALDSLDGQNNYGAWIYRIAVNHCIDQIRRKRAPEFSYDEYVENGGAIPDQSFTAVQGLAGSEMRSQVLALVERLSPEHRAVMLLHCMENLPYKRIARVLGCSIGTVMSRLHYARKYLREAMQVRAVI